LSFIGNHTAYKQFRGRRVPAEEVEELYQGLQQSQLNDFDMLLSGYAASKEVVNVVGKIARDLRDRTSIKPGSFFWSACAGLGLLHLNTQLIIFS